ncbi:unnamed protein product [Ceutorhynchus assimilis]|uniref:Phorbol-ester/DAG-type domain-containing protein n=1 Tax=Ceutorhynchus assimilis TaxID=467358 RepID=A0A9N9QNM1_9CUCU|nr:unnamed protein product [Ceutorhynchus assimilis]
MATAYIPESDELWKECAEWLTRWEMIRPDHEAHWSESTIADFADILRDGVLLCKLLNKIDPGCIDLKDVSLKPTMTQVFCLRNINLFLKTCQSSFGMFDLFKGAMLLDPSNIHEVLCTLSKLSRTEKALKTGIPGFSIPKVKIREEAYIFQSLTEIIGSQPPSYRDSGQSIISIDSAVTNEEIYQDLILVRCAIEQTQPQERRDFVIRELLDTEKNYVDLLNKLKMYFMVPLQNQMRPEDHATVFHKIKELYEIHSAFLVELTKIRTNKNIMFVLGRLSQIFQKFKERFLIYGSYCANLTRATNLLQDLCNQDYGFNETVIKHEKEVNNRRFKLRDVLFVPMQRILKYHLLLDNLTTDEHNEEYVEMDRAHEAMKDVASYIDEVVKHSNVINYLQDHIVDWKHEPEMNISSYGKLIKDAELKMKAHDDQKTRNRYMFIFDKAILICKAQNNQFAFRDILNIMEYHVEEIHNAAVLNNQGDSNYKFRLVKNGKQITIWAHTLELKEQIVWAINEAHDNIRPKSLAHTDHILELTTFANPIQCMYCCKYLKGLIFQGYLCQICNCAVHKECIQISGGCGVSPLRLQASIPNGTSDRDPLRNQLWYVGEIDRSTASEKLIRRENGTFLIRRNRDSTHSHTISLKWSGRVKHMRIKLKIDGDIRKYYLSEFKFFSSIEEMILRYENYSLEENFDSMADDVKLLYPFHQLRAVALRNYDAIDRSQLSFKEKEIIIVIGKDGYKEGWWKGQTEDDQIGYFRVSFIKLEGEVQFD